MKNSVLAESFGRSLVEALVGLFTALLLLPPIVAAVVHLATTLEHLVLSVLAIAIPWLGLVALVAVLGACLAAILAGRTHTLPTAGPPTLPPPVPPTPRPVGSRDQRYDH